MPSLSAETITNYLTRLVGAPVTVLRITPLNSTASVKAYGYGTPLRIDYQSGSGAHVAVIHTIHPGAFGHEHMPDRARELLWEHRAFNRLPRHIRSLDVGGFAENGALEPLGKIEEFFLLTEYAEGREYAADLGRIRDQGSATPDDFARADALCDYLVGIHSRRGEDPALYLRRARELLGDAECIMGLVDSYPPDSAVSPEILKQIEHLSVDWRWKLKTCAHRSRQVHGDFHPWNILFRPADDFTVLDRSRGEFGDPADDVTCLSINYLFFSLQCSGRLEGPFEQLFLRFWNRYLEHTGDREMLRVAAPFFAFRALVLASPVWYPKLDDPIRRTLARFMIAVLKADSFDPMLVNAYCAV